MKRRFLFVTILAIFMVSSVVFSESVYAQKGCGPCQYSENDKIASKKYCPQVSVEITDAFRPGSPADHTYVKLVDGKGGCYSCGCFGARSGGKYLDLTRSDTFEKNFKTIIYMASTPPCKWKWIFYPAVGTCHQLANRGLYHTGKTVRKARWYGFTSLIYNTYGDIKTLFLLGYHMRLCIRKAGPWQPGVPQPCDATIKSLTTISNFEKLIFDKYFGAETIELKRNNLKQKYRRYRDEWLMTNIAVRLGPKYPAIKADEIKKIRDDMLAEKEKLDMELVETENLTDDLLGRYNKLFNYYLDMYREKIFDRRKKEEFERFFDMGYKEEFDIRLFRPQQSQG